MNEGEIVSVLKRRDEVKKKALNHEKRSKRRTTRKK
jgi:hypothetical protein